MLFLIMVHGVRGIYCEKALCCSLAEADATLYARAWKLRVSGTVEGQVASEGALIEAQFLYKDDEATTIAEVELGAAWYLGGKVNLQIQWMDLFRLHLLSFSHHCTN